MLKKPHSPPIPPLLAISFGILAVSTASIFIRFAQVDAPSLVIAAWRLSLAAIILLPLILFRHRNDLAGLNSPGNKTGTPIRYFPGLTFRHLDHLPWVHHRRQFRRVGQYDSAMGGHSITHHGQGTANALDIDWHGNGFDRRISRWLE